MIVGLIGFALALTVLQAFFGSRVPGDTDGGVGMYDSTPSMSPEGTVAWSRDEYAIGGDGSAAPSIRNVQESMVPGNNIAPLERQEYSAHIRTTDLEEVCATLLDLKAQSYVVSENEERTKTSCSFRFKVERTYVDEVLSTITALGPDTLVGETETIQEQITDYTSQLEILNRQQLLLEETLVQTTTAYDSLTEVAREAHDVETLSNVISSKLAQVERLTRERTALAATIEQVMRAKSQALDSVRYARFSVSADLYQVISLHTIRDSWMYATQHLATRLNTALQRLTVGLVANLADLVVVLAHVALVMGLAWACYRFARSFLPLHPKQEVPASVTPAMRKRVRQQEPQ